MKGKAHHNPILDTRSYVVEFPNGAEAEFAANIIAENMYAQCNQEGNQFVLLKGIQDHKTDERAVSKSE